MRPVIAALIPALLLVAAAPVPVPLASAVAQVERDWAVANYETPAKGQVAALDALLGRIDALVARWPASAEPLVWRGVVRVTKAGVVGGLSAFGMIKTARGDLEAADRIDPAAAAGLGLSQLGVLYSQVPGPPLAFGNRVKAKAYFDRALAVDPDSLAINLGFGDFLFNGGQYARAAAVLRHALAAPPRPGQAVSEKGRRDEVDVLLAKIAKKLR